MSADDKTRISPRGADTNVGTQLSGIYELDERIASGGMGEVYRGHNIQTGDHVAIKIVLPEFARDQTILSLFRKEASILNHLSHDAIVRYHVFTIDPGIGRPYLAMEFVNGESLFDVMRRGAMSTQDVRKLCHRLASGLSAVHEAGAVHRDLSPDNIILPGGSVARAKIIDFGIARSATVGGETLIGGKFAGKYNYVSPEQLGLYGGEVSEQSDIYSLGLVLAAALRGKPLEMSGSQLEIVEKRRTVPDLSNIDDDFRPIIEAMLQPDPQDRPTSAAIARMTRDGEDLDGTLAPRSTAPHSRPNTEPPAERSKSARPWIAAPSSIAKEASITSQAKADTGPDFVRHVPPAHLSRPRPVASETPQMREPARRSNTRSIAIAATATVVIVAGTGAYMGGLLPLWNQPPVTGDSKTSLTPDLSKAPTMENVAEGKRPAENGAASQTQTTEAKPVQDAQPETADNDVQESARLEAGRTNDVQTPAEQAQAPRTEIPAPINGQKQEIPRPSDTIIESLLPTEVLEQPPSLSDISNDEAPAQTPATDTASQASSPEAATPSPSQPAAKNDPSSTTTTSQPGLSQSQTEGSTLPPNQPDKALETLLPDAGPPSSSEPAIKNAQNPTATTSQPRVSQQSIPPLEPDSADEPGETVMATNIPRPQIPATEAIDGVAARISWLRDYRGGDCFYATATSATDKAIEIEGFGTTVKPFTQMMEAFQEKFHVEPDISVRLIGTAQCGVTDFLRSLGTTAAEKPHLVLDRTSVPNGTPISGTLETVGGLRSSLLLIDHKGMAFNLDKRVTVQSGKATFSIPIGLGVADQAAGKAVPQIIVAVTGADDIEAAAFSSPTPATVALAEILAEIQKKGLEFSATAKYFRLGG
jgi:serine/threonine protein kinase